MFSFYIYNKRNTIIFLSVLFLSFYSSCAFADSNDSAGVFTTVTDIFNVEIKSLYLKLEQGVKYVFTALCLISLVWNFGQILLRGGQFGEVFSSLVKTILTIGFFFWLIQDAPHLLFNSLSEFNNYASSATGSSGLRPSQMVSKGLDFANTLLKNQFEQLISPSGFSTVVDMLKGDFGGYFQYSVNFILIIVSYLVLSIIFLIIGFNMMMAQITFTFVSCIGFFLIALAGSPYTRDIAMSYLKAVLGAGVNYFGMIISATIGLKVFEKLFQMNSFVVGDEWTAMIGQNCTIIVSAYSIYLIVTKLPSLLSQLVSHASFGTGQASSALVGAVSALAIQGPAKAGLHALGQGATALKSSVASGVKNMAKNARNTFSNNGSSGM